MFEFYKYCTFQTSGFSWTGLGLLIVAALALYVAYINLKVLLRSHKVQSHMNLINLENETMKNYINLKNSIDEHANSTSVRQLQNFNADKIQQSKIINTYK